MVHTVQLSLYVAELNSFLQFLNGCGHKYLKYKYNCLYGLCTRRIGSQVTFFHDRTILNQLLFETFTGFPVPPHVYTWTHFVLFMQVAATLLSPTCNHTDICCVLTNSQSYTWLGIVLLVITKDNVSLETNHK